MKKIFIKFILIVFIFSVGVTEVFAVSSNKNKPYQVPILVYHSFGPALAKKESKMQLHYRITTTMFEAQMKYLYDNGYHPISFSTYVDSLKNNTKLPDKAVVLTFDDGWKTQYKYAVPILEKYNFTATFFIISNMMSAPYMNLTELKDLVAHGFDIESHTQTHKMLPTLSSKKLTIELVESKKTLEDKLGIKINTIAYPNYKQNTVVRNAVKNAGYLGARAGWNNFKNSTDHVYELTASESVNNPNPFLTKRLPDLP